MVAGKFAFVMELQAGMRTQYLNWREIVEREAGIQATWVPVTYYEESGLIERMKFVPQSVRAVWRSYLQVERGLRDEKFDAVLFNTHNPAVTHRRSLKTHKAFLMFDVTPCQYDAMADWYGHTADKKGFVADYKSKKVRETFREAAGLFAWSNWTAQSAIEDYGADPKRIHIVPPGINTEKWTPGTPQDKPADGKVRLLFTGGNFERKGGDLLLKWAKTTGRKNWELHLVTQDNVEAIPGVVVHNNIGSNAAELIQLARQSDLFALPTRADCFSIASLEAMAAGLPVITCDVGGISDIVRDGETGYLIKPDDYDALHDRLDALLDSPDLRQRLGRRGREVVVENFEARDLVRRGLRLMQT